MQPDTALPPGLIAGRALAAVMPFHPEIYLRWCERLGIRVGIHRGGLFWSWDEEHCTGTPDQVDLLQGWMNATPGNRRALRSLLKRRAA